MSAIAEGFLNAFISVHTVAVSSCISFFIMYVFAVYFTRFHGD
jgi:hypothetical protein